LPVSGFQESSWSRKALPVSLLALLALVQTGCGEEVAVRQSTRVYQDGSIFRTVEVSGRESDGTLPGKSGWLAEEAGVRIGDAEAWGRVDRRAGQFAVEGLFDDPGQVPPSLAHRTDAGWVADRIHVSVARDDLVVLARWSYEEVASDPFGETDMAAALDGLTDLASRVLREELSSEFGKRVDPARAEAFLRREARELALQVMSTLKQTPHATQQEARAQQLATLLSRYGVDVPEFEGEDPLDTLTELLDPFMSWARDRTARSISSEDEPVSPEQLPFWPNQDELFALWDEGADVELTPEVSELRRLSETLVRGMTGYYGDFSSPRFRFEISVELPGVLVHTNGTVTEEGAFWLLRGDDLSVGSASMRAEAVELNHQALVALGARRDLDKRGLVQLLDILARRDREGKLAQLLSRCLEEGRLSLLADKDEIPEGMEHLARELLDLLDPSRPR
jgi:hypothetical protein